MTDEWQIRLLGELCDVLDNKRRPITKSDRTPGEFPYYGATGILDYIAGYIFAERLILIGEDGAKWAAGDRTAFSADGKYWVNNHAHVIRPHRDIIIDEWLIYYLNWSDLSPFITGLTVPKLNQEKMRSISLPVPTIPEQKRIVAILDEAFENINKAIANTEKGIANTRELFTGFLTSIFSNSDVQRQRMPIGKVATIFDGPHATPKTVGEGPIFLGISALQDGHINLAETRHVTPSDFVQWTRRVKPMSGDVVFSYETRLGQAAIIPNGLECCLGRRMGLIRVDREKLDPRYLVYQYVASPFRKFLESRVVRGATVDRISLKEFPTFYISVPALERQVEVVDRIDLFRLHAQQLEAIFIKKLSALSTLKNAILQKAFAGKLTTNTAAELEAAE